MFMYLLECALSATLCFMSLDINTQLDFLKPSDALIKFFNVAFALCHLIESNSYTLPASPCIPGIIPIKLTELQEWILR